MVESVFGIAALCVVSTVLCRVMERYGKEYSMFIAIAVIALVAAFAFVQFSPLIDLINSLFLRSGFDSGYTAVLFKAIGICYVTQLSCDICRDNGQNAIATLAELSGKLALLLISLPLFEALIKIIGQLSAV